MATTPRTKNPNDAALSAVEEALRLDYTPEEDTGQVEATGTKTPLKRRPALPVAETPQVRRPDTQRRSEAPRIPAPPRRTDQPPVRRAEEARRPAEEPRRADLPARAYAEPEPETGPAPVRARAAEQRNRSRFAANDDRRPLNAPARRPSRLIYPGATVLSVAWALFVVVYAMSTGGLFGGDATGSLLTSE